MTLLLFADRLPPLIGGMEQHAGAFIHHFTGHPHFPLVGTVTRGVGSEYVGDEPKVVFFNSGYWIEEMDRMRELFPNALFVYRTGGNEIIKAPLIHAQIEDHSARQAYWRDRLNNSLDLLITNSAYTEERLRAIGVTTPFARVVGGVDPALLKGLKCKGPPTLFCAARFVPYKNHATLLAAFERLPPPCRLRLAGEGPLLQEIQRRARDRVDFLGGLTAEATCQEIAHANLYVQLSCEYRTEVPGGSYPHTEGMGRSLLEAITAGTYIVAGRSGALDEIVTPDRGALVDPHNVDEITACVEQLLTNPPAQGEFTEEFSWTRLFGRYESLWRNHEVAGRH